MRLMADGKKEHEAFNLISVQLVDVAKVTTSTASLHQWNQLKSVLLDLVTADKYMQHDTPSHIHNQLYSVSFYLLHVTSGLQFVQRPIYTCPVFW